MATFETGIPADVAAEGAPAFAYDLIMISIYAADKNNQLLEKARRAALAHGADRKMVEMAIYRGEQLSILDEL